MPTFRITFTQNHGDPDAATTLLDADTVTDALREAHQRGDVHTVQRISMQCSHRTVRGVQCTRFSDAERCRQHRRPNIAHLSGIKRVCAATLSLAQERLSPDWPGRFTATAVNDACHLADEACAAFVADANRFFDQSLPTARFTTWGIALQCTVDAAEAVVRLRGYHDTPAYRAALEVMRQSLMGNNA